MSLEHSPDRSNCGSISGTGERLLTSRELEDKLHVHHGWAAKNRLGLTAAPIIPYVRIGRARRYAPSVVDKAVEEMAVQSTAA